MPVKREELTAQNRGYGERIEGERSRTRPLPSSHTAIQVSLWPDIRVGSKNNSSQAGNPNPLS